MRLDHATWYEVRAYLRNRGDIIVPTGSTEQHGPIGLIGTDAICAELIAERAASRTGSYVAPTLAYTPAPFNTSFPGTISVSAALFRELAREILSGLQAQGFARIYILNGHGANLEPLREATSNMPVESVRVRSWWDFDEVNALRQLYYGDWEGMHATPSEIAITRAAIRTVDNPDADRPPRPLTADYVTAHSGDRHGPPDEHRAAFPDGRVGSHSALATADHGRTLIAAAEEAVFQDLSKFLDRDQEM